MSMTIYWCTIYEDINEIVLHNSFINMLFNQKIWKWEEEKNHPKVLFPPRAQRVKLLVQDSTCSIISLKWLYKKMLLYNVRRNSTM